MIKTIHFSGKWNEHGMSLPYGKVTFIVSGDMFVKKCDSEAPENERTIFCKLSLGYDVKVSHSTF